MAILPDNRALQAEVAKLKAQLAASEAEKAKLAANQKTERKVSVKARRLDMKDKDGNPCKGNIAVYGMGRFPISFYPNQWEKLKEIAADIDACIEANKDSLSFGKDS